MTGKKKFIFHLDLSLHQELEQGVQRVPAVVQRVQLEFPEQEGQQLAAGCRRGKQVRLASVPFD